MGRKVLVLLNNIPLYGSERGNINVFYALKEHEVEALFVTHAQYGDLYINPHLDKLGLAHTPADYIGKICRRKKHKEYLVEIKNSLRGNYRLWNIIKEYKPDYIHIPTEASFISMFITLWLTKVPVIYRLGDNPRQNRKIFTAIWKKLIVPRVHKFVAISNYIKQKLMELGVPENKIEVIYNSPPQRKIPTEHDTFKSNGNSFVVTYLGQLTIEKGVDLLVKAAVELCKKYNNIYFYIAGDYEWQNPFAKGLINRVQELNLDNRIKFPGMIEDTKQLLKSSQLHVCPSVWDEPLSNVTVEAKEAGVPSVIFPSGGLPELIRHNIDGFICKDKTSDSLIEAIEYYLNDPDKLTRAGAAALASMHKLGITKEAYKDKWVKIYADHK
jgi:glycosyltransferase involved in cell wall biosynthesis